MKSTAAPPAATGSDRGGELFVNPLQDQVQTRISEDLVGQEISFVTVTRDGISRTKSFKIWHADGPGAWLTHGRPGGVASQVGASDGDDVKAVELVAGRV